jgi:hypothetical protein
MHPVIAARTQPSQDTLLVVGVLAAAVLTFPRWGLGAPLVVAAVTLAMGVSRRLYAPLSIAAASAAAAGFVHLAVAPEHFAEWWGFGLFFVLCGEVQLGWALLARRAPGKAALSVGLAGSLLLVVLWALSRTSGLPFGPEPGVPEAVGTPDVLAVALELVTAASCAWALTQQRASTAIARPLVVCALALTAAAAGWALLSI